MQPEQEPLQPEIEPGPEEILPTAEEMISRLNEIDLERFNLKILIAEVKGSKEWLFVMVMPVTALSLLLFTMLGTLITGQFVISFVVTAFFLFLIGKMLSQYENKFMQEARFQLINRVKEYEGEYGILPHFKDFLPARYRHLWQCLKKGQYHHVDQYVTAVRLLQQKLDSVKFTRLWHLKHPETAPMDEAEQFEFISTHPHLGSEQ